MTPERWQEIDRVWQAVLARPDHERAAAVLELSAGDDTLRRDVESLLAHLARASAAGFGDTPLSVPAPLASLIGRQLGPYTVHALLGVGGMGEVYRAHDASLGRDVAIKILPAPWLADPERRARFDREARLLASLNHPNIGAIYGVHESDVGGRALVLELVEGDTLAERLARQPRSAGGRRGLPLDDVVTIASQLTAALEGAHASGIVHRDLKPANIKVTPDGRLKVLDFGLARAVSGADSESGTPPGPPEHLSGSRLLLGTPAYMSPEQARGRAVDKRADIWAFGCVLYEMLTGVQAFGGADVAETLANVIGAEPAWSALPAETPAALRICLRRCLQKDPHQRIHDIGDVRLAMEGAFLATDADHPSRGRIGFSLTSAGLGGLALIAAAAMVIASHDRRPVETPETSRPNPPVIATPRAGGGGGSVTARTIQEAIDLVAAGGTVQVLPGTYPEAITITKKLTLEATGVRSGTVVIAPPGMPEAVIDIATTEPVILRDLTVYVPGAGGIRGLGGVNLTAERMTIRAADPPIGSSSLIAVSNDSTVTGLRARAVIRASSLDGTVVELERRAARPHSIAVDLEGDVDGLVEHNMIRRMGGVCLRVMTRADLGGETNVDIVNNDIDECHPVARVSAIIVGSPPIEMLSPERPLTASGTVNIIANTIRNTPGDCLTVAIAFDVFSGRIERNRIVDFVQPCATRTLRTIPAAIWIGLRVTGIQMPPVVPTVRFNDIHGNARAGLRIAPNQTIPVNATCNYWGSERGPSGIGTGDGDAILVEPGAASPIFVPHATSPVASTPTPRC